MLILKNNPSKKWCDNKTFFWTTNNFYQYYYNFIKEVEINNNNYNTIMHNIMFTNTENNKLNILICIENLITL